MAITANIKRGASTYDILHAGSIDSVVVATSDQYEQPNFRYVVKVIMEHYYDDDTEVVFYVQPNPYGKGIFNLRQLFVEHKNIVLVPNPTHAHPFIFYMDAVLDKYMIFRCDVRIDEGWEVSGVFTINPDGNGGAKFDFNIVHGLRNNLTPAITRVDANSVAYSDVLPNTFYDRVKHRLPGNLSSGYTYLVAHEDDQGCLVFDGDDGTYNAPNGGDVFLAQYDFYDVYGDYLGTKYTDAITPEKNKQFYAPAYPSNVANFCGWFEGTAFYSIKLMDEGLINQLSVAYLVVLEENNCRYDNVRVAWIGENGGLEYFNFPLKNERTYSMDRKQYMKPYGNYGTVGAGISETDAGDFGPDLRDVRNIVNREATVNTVLDISSDWLTETEFNYLKGLLIAEHVYILTNINGEFKTVVIDDKNYLERRERNTKKYNLKLQLRYGQIYQAIDYQLLPTPPVPCTYYNMFIKMGGSSTLTVAAVGDDMVITANAATRSRYITVSVGSTLGSPVPGTFYYVRVQLSSPMPTSNYLGILQLGDGTGQVVNYNGLTTDFLASGIWGGPTTTSYIYLKLPNFLGGATWSGTITISIGTNTCP